MGSKSLPSLAKHTCIQTSKTNLGQSKLLNNAKIIDALALMNYDNILRVKIMFKYELTFESNNFSKSNHKFRCDT